MDAQYLTSTDPFYKVKGVFPNVLYKFGEPMKKTKDPTGQVEEKNSR